MTSVDSLNAAFGIGDTLRFAAGPGGLPTVEIANRMATARVCLHGAHVMAYTPRGSGPLLWMSGSSRFEPGSPIRGGIPVCWPWFGAHPASADLPAHGLARLLPWRVDRTEHKRDDDTTHLVLALEDSAATRAVWPGAFALRLEVTVGAALRVALAMTNRGSEPWTVTAALHTYFAVSDVASVRVHGFDGLSFVDTVGGSRRPGVQAGPVVVRGETDLIFHAWPGTAVIEDPGWQRRIRVTGFGSASAVVWNPWVAKSRRMPDFGDDEYPGMICVETANAAGDERLLRPGAEHVLATEIALDKEF